METSLAEQVHHDRVIVLFDAEIHVHYGFLWLIPDGEDQPSERLAAVAGQRNGLCGAALGGVLSMTTGLHTGNVPFVVRWHDAEPAVGDDWEDVVEAPFAPAEPGMTLAAFDTSVKLRLPAAGSLRARYSGTGMDAARAEDTRVSGPPLDRYQLDLWAAPTARDTVIRETSKIAKHRHEYARSAPVVTAEERAARAQAARERQRQAATRLPAVPARPARPAVPAQPARPAVRAQRATPTSTTSRRAVPLRAAVPSIVSDADRAV
ncbi:MAG: hypothetical protein QOE51_28, partial [Actinoplanes sp.]|nr:hypothetical protein [Actinoplanes sp.]